LVKKKHGPDQKNEQHNQGGIRPTPFFAPLHLPFAASKIHGAILAPRDLMRQESRLRVRLRSNFFKKLEMDLSAAKM
jgi:hypothetical protein